MFKITRLMLCAGMLTAAIAAKAADLPPEILNNVMQICRPDYHRVCPDVLPGGGRVGRCLMDHERELAPACLKAIKFAHAVEVCLPDYQRYCQGVQSNMEAVVQCLAERQRSLSPECGDIVSANAPYVMAIDVMVRPIGIAIASVRMIMTAAWGAILIQGPARNATQTGMTGAVTITGAAQVAIMAPMAALTGTGETILTNRVTQTTIRKKSRPHRERYSKRAAARGDAAQAHAKRSVIQLDDWT
jgi:hypothetical protein